MKVVLIVAVCKHTMAIGKDNDLLWDLPADMQFFKTSTAGFPVLTGRKNYESIPEKYRPLPNRENIVITRDKNYAAPGAFVLNDIQAGIKLATTFNKEKCYVIGGGQIYKQCLALGLIDEMLITWVDANLDGDAFFPKFKESEWEKEELATHQKDAKNMFDFTIVKYSTKFTG